MTNRWSEAQEGRIPTKNEMGFMFLEISSASQAFIEQVVHCTDIVIDVGSAYGIVTLPVLERAHCQVVAFDLSQEHLDILTSKVSEDKLHQLVTIQGRFPEDFNFPKNSLDAIHCSYLMHFLTGKEVEDGLTRCFRALKSGGKIYINVVSPYFKPFKNVLSLYEENAAKGLKWPGEIFDFKDHVPEKDRAFTPHFAHAFKKEILEKALLEAGFQMQTSVYYDLHEPTWYASDGKGLVAAIAIKP